MSGAFVGPMPTVEQESARFDKDQENERLKNLTLYDQQCLMMKEFLQFKDREDRNLNYKNITVLKVNSTDEAIKANNIIHGSDKFKAFINIPNHIIAALVPRIRIYKSYFLEDSQKLDIEIPLEDHIKEEDLLEENLGRSFGYGLSSFTWANSSMNEADRNISADLNLRFTNMDAFTKVRKGVFTGDVGKVQDPEKYLNFRFLELIYQVPSQTNSTFDEKIKQYQSTLRFKIKVAVGWDFDDNLLNELQYEGDIEELKQAIRTNNYILYLYNKGHDLKIDNLGRLNLTINYQSANEAIIADDVRSNVLATPTLLTKLDSKINLIDKRIELRQEQMLGRPEAEVTEQLNLLKDEKDKVESKTNSEIYSSFIDGMFKRKMIKLFEIKNSDIEKFKKSVFPLTEEQKNQQTIKINFNSVKMIEDIYSKDRNALINNLLDKTDKSSNSTTAEELKKLLIVKENERIVIPYFYLGELLDYVLDIANKPTGVTKEKINLLVGPFVYERLKEKAIKGELFLEFDEWKEGKDKAISINASLADIPIPLEAFLAWLEEETIAKRRRRLSLKQFLSTLLTKFLISSLTPTAFGKQFIAANPKVDMHIFNSIEKNGEDILVANGNNITLDQIAEIDQSNKYDNSENLQVVPYLYIQVFYNDSDEKYLINEQKNAESGIYHLKSGVDRGLVKEVIFSKDDVPTMAALIYSQQGTVNPQVLRTAYNAEVRMVGNTVLKPGMMVYIDPSYTLSIPSNKEEMVRALDEIGLGGFYIVTKTSNNISPGSFSTNVSCRFTNYGTRE